MFGFKSAKQQEAPPAAPAQPAASPAASGGASVCIQALDAAITQRKGKGAVLKLYLQNFKLFNDTFGYDYGEQLLSEVHQFLLDLGDARVLRHSGVEFILLLEKFGYTQAMDLAQEVRDRFEETWRIGDMDYMCQMALGVVFYPEKAESGAQAMKALESAVAEAEQKGQNQIVVYSSELEQKLQRKRGIANLIRMSVEHPEILEVRYRPTFNVDKGVFTRAECYLRIFTPEFGVVGAAELFPIAEDSGLIVTLNTFAIRKACEQIRSLLDGDVGFESIAVPISPVQFLQKQFVDDMKAIIREYQIPERKLALEITESVFVNTFTQVNIVMQELSDLGIEFVLNEFGTGYSGINNILDLPVDVLKLERMFIWQLETNPRSGFVIEGLIQIAHKLGMKLIAEGVETENQVEQLRRFGCKYEQGFFYSPTVTGPELSMMLGRGVQPQE